MRRVLVMAAVLAGIAGAAAAAPTPARCAACVAALKARAEPLAQRLKRGDAAAEAPLVPIVTSSFAFVGTVYKQGVRAPQADELLRGAEKAQAQLPPAELDKLQRTCQLEGEQLMKDANAFERMFVSRAVRNRIDQLKK
ncbi:hypothetical protein [Piscinibacter sp. XHJ-5]|uniref:hypothetical protein n=1 Tax=Piscinibacter sp. XHJ-5 TaxID=3037797 RepID=UPI002452E2A7|nr:hypothetical protein [Piscinibacter sp. XHJ-5]